MFDFTPHPMLKAPSDEEMLWLTDPKHPERHEQLCQLWEAHEEAIRLAELNPLEHGFEFESWGWADGLLEKYNQVHLYGGNGCLHKDSMIYDPLADESKRVSERDEPFYVYAIDPKTKKRVVARAQPAYRKPDALLYHVVLACGNTYRVSGDHLVLTPTGYERISALSPGDSVLHENVFLPECEAFHRPTKRDTFLSVFRQGVRHLSGIVRGWMDGCFAYSRQYDELPPSHADYVQGFSPSRDDVLGHTLRDARILAYIDGAVRFSEDMNGGWASKFRRILMRLYDGPLSSGGCQDRSEGLFSGILSRVFYKPCKYALRLCVGLLFLLTRPQSLLALLHRQYAYVSVLLGNLSSFLLAYRQIETITPIGQGEIWDFEVEEYGNYWYNGCYHHNSSKSNYGARTVVRAAYENPNSIIYCFAQDAHASVVIQQKYVYQYLPPECKKTVRTDKAYAKYSSKNGFTGDSLIIPCRNGGYSEIFFSTYSQFISNRAKFEGLEVGSRTPKWHNIGFWFDEYLESGDLYNTMLYRLGRRNAKILVTFTPIDGYTPFVAQTLKNSVVTRTMPTNELVFPGEDDPKSVEIVREDTSRGIGVVYFPTEFNPWGGFEAMCKMHSHKSVGERLTRFYGIPVKSMTTLFPLFSTDVNVLSSEENRHGMAFPDVTTDSFCRYQVIDPAGRRNYAILWAAVNQEGEIFIYREWPDYDTYGEWAVFGAGAGGEGKWIAGPAAKKIGLNVEGYSTLFKQLEDEPVYERMVDSRYAANEGNIGTDLFADFANCDPPLYVVPTDGQIEDKGLTKLDDWFSYNPNVDIDSANRPRCFVHESCKNLINALINYAAQGKRDEALKDFIDCLRYLRMHNRGEGIYYVNEKLMEVGGQIGNGY